MTESPSYLLPALALLLILVAAGIILWRRRQASATSAASHLSTVSSKRAYPWHDRMGYYVTFCLPAGQLVEVEVNLQWYNYLTLGDHGQLTLQNGHFGGFDKQEPASGSR